MGWRAAQRARLARCFARWAAERAWHYHKVRLQELDLERTELHEANSRIATLAFAQAGVPMEVAHQQLMAVLMPHTTARKADERCKQQDGEAAVLHAKLERALSALGAQAARHQREREAAEAPRIKQRALDALRSQRDDAKHAAAQRAAEHAADAGTDMWSGADTDADADAGAGAAAGARAAAAAAGADAAAAPGLERQLTPAWLSAAAAASDADAAATTESGMRGPRETETVAVQCSLFMAEQERQRSALALEYQAKVAALKEVAALQTELESRGRELEELTAMLIEAKVAAAQQGSDMLEKQHEVVQLTTKLEVGELPETSPRDSISGIKDRRRASPAGRSPRTSKERHASFAGTTT